MVCTGLKEVLVAGYPLLQDRVDNVKELRRIVKGHFLKVSEHHAVYVVVEEFVDKNIDVLVVVVPLIQKIHAGQLALGTVLVRETEAGSFWVER